MTREEYQEKKAKQYSHANDMFSRRAHEEAYKKVYPQFLPDDYVLVDLYNTERDLAHDEDYEIIAYHGDLDKPLKFGIQERFRRAKFSGYREVTIKDRDLLRGENKQVYNTHADFIVFGYFDDENSTLLETVVVDQGLLRWLIMQEAIDFTRHKHGDKEMTFIALSFDDLIENHAAVFHYAPN